MSASSDYSQEVKKKWKNSDKQNKVSKNRHIETIKHFYNGI